MDKISFLERIENLPKNVRDYLWSNDSRMDLERACFLYDIKEDDIEKMALPVRDIFLKDIPLAQLPMIIQRNLQVNSRIASGIAYELGKKSFSLFSDYFADSQNLLKQWEQSKFSPIISEEKAQRRVLDIEPWILEEKKEKENQAAMAQKKMINLSLNEALSKYPKVGEQDLTANPLKLRYFPNPVRPSIKNWITDFHDNMGAGKHGAVDRGNYLFHSENGKKLTPVERQKLSTILKSLDENSPLAIDPETQKIIFQETNNKQPATNNQRIEDRRYINNEEQKDIFQRNEGRRPITQKFSSPRQTENSKRATAVENNYFQVPKYQPEVKPEPKMDRIFEGNKPSVASNNYSPNFKDIAPTNFSSEQKTENTIQNKPEVPVIAEGKMSFSSPQKFPVEKDIEIAEKKNVQINQQESPLPPPVQVDQIIQPQKKPITQSQWTIRPSTYFNDEENESSKSMQPKIKGNIVDLKN